MLKQLFGAVLHGFGSSAGADLYAETKKELAQAAGADARPPQPIDPRAAAKQARAAAREARREDRARRAKEKRDAHAVDAELRALKARIARDE